MAHKIHWNKTDESKARTLQPVFWVGGMQYVPHTRPDTWVTYGGQMMTLKDLKFLRAELKMEPLAPQGKPFTPWVAEVAL
jgi:hypothetical protein